MKRTYLKMLAGVCGCFLATMAVSAQTLTVVEPDSHHVSAPLSSIRGGTAPVTGPTEIPHHPLPLQADYKNNGSGASAEAAPDTALQTTLGPLINATAGTSFDGINALRQQHRRGAEPHCRDRKRRLRGV